jgi:hypothetical protein
MSTRLDEPLAATWASMSERAGPLRSLDPTRELATPLDAVHARALVELPPPLVEPLSHALAAGLITLALAQLDAFPGNLFWDLDLIACEVAREAARMHAAHEAEALVADRFARMARLQHAYGRDTPINFSYVHDFVYGYDWVKWRRRSGAGPHERPFGLAFLTHMERRADELLALIDRDDREYPRLSDESARNPFPFSRRPADELALHRALAGRAAIPVPTWSTRFEPSDDTRDWAAQRIELARELGLLHRG